MCCFQFSTNIAQARTWCHQWHKWSHNMMSSCDWHHVTCHEWHVITQGTVTDIETDISCFVHIDVCVALLRSSSYYSLSIYSPLIWLLEDKQHSLKDSEFFGIFYCFSSFGTILFIIPSFPDRPLLAKISETAMLSLTKLHTHVDPHLLSCTWYFSSRSGLSFWI